MNRLLVDVPEAARMLGCGRTLVYRLIAEGRLRTVKLGRLTRIPLSSLEGLAAAASSDSSMAPLAPTPYSLQDTTTEAEGRRSGRVEGFTPGRPGGML